MMEKLEHGLEELPLLKYLLPIDDLRPALLSRELPFHTDDEYYGFKLLEFRCRYLSRLDTRSLTELSSPHGLWDRVSLQEKGQDLARMAGMFRELGTCLGEIGRCRGEKSNTEVYEPRILRLARHMDLSIQETDCLAVLVLFYSEPAEMSKFNTSSFSINGEAVFDVLNIPSSDFYAVLHPNGKLQATGLVQFERRSSEYNLMKGDINCTREVMLALRGLPVDTEMYMAFAQTPLAEVVRAESGFELKPLDLAVQEDEVEGSEEIDDAEQDKLPKWDDLDPGAGLIDFMRQREQNNTSETTDDIDSLEDDAALKGYRSDIEYLEDKIEWLTWLVIRKKKEFEAKGDEDLNLGDDKRKLQRKLMELKQREHRSQTRIRLRLELTRRGHLPLPRLEELRRIMKLDAFDVNVLALLVAFSVSEQFHQRTGLRNDTPEVDDFTYLFTENLTDQIAARQHFYKSAPLIQHALIHLSNTFDVFRKSEVSIDRRLTDFLIGLDTEFNELVDNSHLYMPKTRMDSVVLPRRQKDQVLRTIESLKIMNRMRRKISFDQISNRGSGVVMLFYGPSGTGKTLMANAVARKMKKKIMLINLPSIGSGLNAEAVIRFIFREALIEDAIPFFDECDMIFEARESGNTGLSVLLTEIERYSGMIIMATNRPQVLDEAMRRRITHEVAFHNPDYQLREQIWRLHLPKGIRLSKDVDLHALAFKYELSGGLIKNAVLAAILNRSSTRSPITQANLEKGARLQQRGSLLAQDNSELRMPKTGLDQFVADESLLQRIREIIMTEKAKERLTTQWGFGENSNGRGLGSACLFHGRPGTGKTFAAEVIACEMGRVLMRVNMAEVISKYIGETGKNLSARFKEAKRTDSVLLLEEIDALLGARTAIQTANDRFANQDVNILLQHIEEYPGLVIMTTNLMEHLDQALFRRFRHVVRFDLPDRALSERLWRMMVPQQTPLADDVDFSALAARKELAPGHIWNVVFRAASRAVLRPDDEALLTQRDLLDALNEEFTGPKEKIIGFHVSPGNGRERTSMTVS